MRWALDNQERFLREQQELDRLWGEEDWLDSVKWTLTPDLMLKAEVVMRVGEREYPATLFYPHLFPDTPAYVRPWDPDQSWSSHQYGDGTLCLEWGPDNWHPNVTGADLIRSAFKLIATERPSAGPRGHVPSRHALTLGQEVRASDRRLVLTRQAADFVTTASAVSHGALSARKVFHSTTQVLFIERIEVAGGQSLQLGDVPSGLADIHLHLFKEITGWWFKVDQDPSTPANYDALVQWATSRGFDFPPPWDALTTGEKLVLLIGPAQTSVALLDLDTRTLQPCSLVVQPSDDAARLPATSFAEKKVGIVGLGSVGSKVAASLARSGVKKFFLVDDDVMLPGNVVRHDLDWGAVGAGKVDGMADQLSLLAPGITVEVRRVRVAGQENAMTAASVLKKLAACDLIIDATASPDVFVQLAAIAARRSKPLIWGELFAGGIGALVARARPSVEPPPLEARAQILGYLHTQREAPFRQARGYDGDPAVPLTAFDAEVMQLAAIVARIALDTLLNREPSEFPFPAYLVGFKKYWIFDAPFDTQPIQLSMSQSPVKTEMENPQAIEALAGLLEDLRGADADRPA